VRRRWSRQLLFHPHVAHQLLSGGDDGLVCVFDTSVAGELDALVFTVNAESAVARFGVFGEAGAFLWVITRTEGVNLWSLGDAERMGNFPQLKMTFLESGFDLGTLVACHYDPPTSRLTLLSSTYEGAVALFDVTPTAVTPLHADAAPTHSAVVRAAVWAAVAAPGGGGAGTPATLGRVMLTAGEDGQLLQWADDAAWAVLAKTPAGGAAAAAASKLVAREHVRHGHGPLAPAAAHVKWVKAQRPTARAPSAAVFGSRAVKREGEGVSTGHAVAGGGGGRGHGLAGRFAVLAGAPGGEDEDDSGGDDGSAAVRAAYASLRSAT
jgi:hypothetical protein